MLTQAGFIAYIKNTYVLTPILHRHETYGSKSRNYQGMLNVCNLSAVLQNLTHLGFSLVS